MKQLQDMLEQTARNLEAFTHPRVSVAWEDRSLVYTRVHNPNPDLGMDILGKKLEDILTDKTEVKRLTAEKQRVLSGKSFHRLEKLHLGGKVHMFDVSLEPTYDDSGAVDGLVSVSIDVTDLIAARQQLTEANARLVKLLGDALGHDGSPRRRKGSPAN